MLELPRAARLTVWFNAWLRGATSTDSVLEGVVDGDAAHHVTGLTDEPGPVPLVLALGRLRNLGATEGRLALPAPGDPLGLAGPIAFNEQTLEAGEGCVLPGSGLGLVPCVVGAGVYWRAHRADPGSGRPDLSEADRDLRAALVHTADHLIGLDLAGGRRDVADELVDLRTSPAAKGWAPGYPPRALAVAAAALRALAIVSLAVGDDDPGRADGDSRLDLVSLDRTPLAPLDLAPLDRAARRALVAACAPPAHA